MFQLSSKGNRMPQGELTCMRCLSVSIMQFHHCRYLGLIHDHIYRSCYMSVPKQNAATITSYLGRGSSRSASIVLIRLRIYANAWSSSKQKHLTLASCGWLSLCSQTYQYFFSSSGLYRCKERCCISGVIAYSEPNGWLTV